MGKCLAVENSLSDRLFYTIESISINMRDWQSGHAIACRIFVGSDIVEFNSRVPLDFIKR